MVQEKTVQKKTVQQDTHGAALWPVWNTTLHLVVSARNRLPAARRLVIDQVAAIDAASNPFRPDSEVRALRRARSRPMRVSALLADLVTISLRAALLSNGCLDPISGEVLRGPDTGPLRLPVRGGSSGRMPPPTDWASIRLVDGCELTVPAGTMLDLSAMAAPYAVDRCVRLVHERLGIGVRVGIGGDVASAGKAPAGGWGSLPVTPVATTSAVSPAAAPGRASMWRSVSVAASPCTYAKALGMAAMLRGSAAPDWLRGLGVSARLVAADGGVTLVGRWPSCDAE